MKRNLKALGLALLAAFALSAVAASAAQALDEFTAEKYPAAITGHQEGGEIDNFFSITAGGSKFTCEVATYEGTLEAGSSTITIRPHYEKCKASGIEQRIHLNGCDYTFHVGETTSPTDIHGSATIDCPVGKQIEITMGGTEGSPLCILDIKAQGPKSNVTYTNKEAEGEATPKKYITIDANIAKIHYTETKKSIFCPLTNNATGEDGTLETTVLVKGYEDLGIHTPVTEDTKTTNVPTNTEGNLIGIDIGSTP